MRVGLIVLIVSLLLLVACTQNENQQEVDTVQSEIQKLETQVTPTKTAAQDIIEYFDKQKLASYQVSYDLNTVYEDVTDKQIIHEYIDKLENIRVDSKSAEGENRIYLTDGAYYVCTNNDGWLCIELGKADAKTPGVQLELIDNITTYQVSRLPRINITRQETDCFRIQINPQASVDYCFSEHGIPLFVKTVTPVNEQIVTSQLSAVSFSLELDPQVFELPAIPVNVGGSQEIPIFQ